MKVYTNDQATAQKITPEQMSCLSRAGLERVLGYPVDMPLSDELTGLSTRALLSKVQPLNGWRLK